MHLKTLIRIYSGYAALKNANLPYCTCEKCVEFFGAYRIDAREIFDK